MTTASINLYIQEKFDSTTIQCVYTQEKGRVLITTEAIPSGSIIFSEKTLHHVTADSLHPIHKLLEDCCQSEDFDYDVMWYWCAVNSLLSQEERKHLEKIQKRFRSGEAACVNPRKLKTMTISELNLEKLRTLIDSFLTIPFPCVPKHVRGALLLFYRQESCGPTEPALILERKLKELYNFDHNYVPAIVLHASNDATFDDDYLEAWRILESTFRASKIDEILKKIRSLIQIWILNCFEAEWDPLAYCTYFLPTFCSHSCLPNALWHIDDVGDFVLVARRPLTAGEEISISYLSDDDLMTPTHNRRKDLADTKQFLCTCQRCEAAADLSRGFSCDECPNGVWFAKTCEEGSDCHPVERLGSDAGAFDTLLDHIEAVGEKLFKCKMPYAYFDFPFYRFRDEDLTTDSIVDYLETFTPYKCCVCGALAADDDVQALLNYEVSLWKLSDLPLDSFDSLPSLECQWGKRLKQHRYIVHLCDTLTSWNLPQTHRNRLLKVKLTIVQNAFPAPNGVAAWTLRDLVVVNLNMNLFNLEDCGYSWSGSEASMKEIEAVLVGTECQLVERTALMLRMFRVLFTVDYEYFRDAHSMMLRLVEEFKACLSKLEKDAKVSDAVTDRLAKLEDILFRMVHDF